MNIRTIESDFEYQAKAIFESMLDHYRAEQSENKKAGLRVFTFAEWLWNNPLELGLVFYERLDEWCGIDDFTEHLNVNQK